MWILLAVVITAVSLLVALNLSSAERKIEHRIESCYAVGDPQFTRSLSALLGPGLVGGNRVTALLNGDEIFPAMLDAIRSASATITFETYIYWSGAIGREFADALADRARAGVKVHVLLDWLGTGKIDSSFISEMEEAGVEICRYHPPRWYTIGRMNNRTHRKLLVVDGRVGFTGGVGIADNWMGHADDEEHWRDSHFRVEGPVVSQMQATFMDNWMKCRSLLLDGQGYFPALARAGDATAQVIHSSPFEGSETVRLMYLLSIASARRRILISNSYFVPDDLASRELIDAARRGVTVEIITPGRWIDTETVRKASKRRWGPLLQAGIRMYEYQGTMYHCKVMIVDDQWISVGSTNFDNRSFRLNDEANLNVLDAGFASSQVPVFEADRARSREITLAMWRHRPLRERILEGLASIIESQL